MQYVVSSSADNILLGYLGKGGGGGPTEIADGVVRPTARTKRTPLGEIALRCSPQQR